MASPSIKDLLSALWATPYPSHPLYAELQISADGETSSLWYPIPEEFDSLVASAGKLPENVHPRVRVGLAQEEEGQTRFMAALSCEFDLNVTKIEDAVSKLKDFPLKASIGILTKNSVQACWLLKGYAAGQEFVRCEAIVKGLCSKLSARSTRFVRLPGGSTRVVSWRVADTPYTLVQFEDVLGLNIKKEPLSLTEEQINLMEELQSALPPREDPPIEEPPQEHEAPPPEQEFQGEPFVEEPETAQPTATPAGRPDLSPALHEKLIGILKHIWVKQSRYKLVIEVANYIGRAGYSERSAVSLIAAAAHVAQDPEADQYSKIVTTIYGVIGKERKPPGQESFEQYVRLHQSPLNDPVLDDKLSKAVASVRSAFPKQKKQRASSRGGGNDDGDEGGAQSSSPGCCDFEITKIVKFLSEPAIYDVTLKYVRNGEEPKEATIKGVEKDVFTTFRLFRIHFFDRTTAMPGFMKQERWLRMIASVNQELQEAPQSANMRGAIEEALIEFLDEKKEKPDLGTLRRYPGYDDDTIYFRAQTFLNHLRDAGLKPAERQVYNILKQIGWENKNRRFDEKQAKIWFRSLSSNGNGQSHPELIPGSLKTAKQESEGEIPF